MNNPVIKSVELINFMCHKHLFLEFDKMITCIGGRNGSGKSSIMVALGLLFGRRAQSLERGSSYKELIKSGCSFSIIRVTLRNIYNFRNDFFGSIIIERRLRAENMQLLIMNENRRIFSTKREDLEILLEKFNIQFDNPLNFLTQEQSKKFLNVLDSSSLYELFVRGTELDKISLFYERAMKDLEKMQAKLDLLDAEVNDINRMLEDGNKKLAVVENIENNRRRIIFLEGEKVFSRLKKKLRSIENVQKEIKNYDFEISKTFDQIEEVQKRISELEARSKRLKVEFERQRIAREERMESSKNAIRGLDLQKIEIKSEIEIINEELKTKIRSLESNKKYRDNYKETLMVDKEEIEKNIEEMKREVQMLINQESQLQPEAENEKTQISKLENRKMQLKSNIRFYSRLKNDQKNFFGENLDGMLREISQTRFSGEIIGPIGLGIKLREQKWYKAASIVLKNVLSHFIVFHKEDRSRLSEIMKRHKLNFSILLPSSNSRNIIKHRKNSRFTTLLDVLNIDNPVITNQLIILLSIEQIILIEDRSVAYKVIRSRPEDVDSCYTLDGDRIKLVGVSLTEFRPRIDRFFFEAMNIDNLVKELQQLPDIQPQKQEALFKLQKRLDLLNSKIEMSQRRVSELIMEIQNIPEAISDDGTLEEEIDMLKRQKEELEGRLLEINNEVVRHEKEIYELSQILAPEIHRDSESLNLRGNEQFLRNNIRILQNKKEEKSRMLAEMASRYDNEKAEILKNYEEVHNPRELQEIDEEIRNLRAQIEITKEIEAKDDIEKSVETLNRLKKSRKALISKFKSRVIKINDRIKLRLKKRDTLGRKIAKEAAEKFENLVSTRGYSGQLIFDHKNRNLDLKMLVNNSSAGEKHTLSGGERSFASICFLLSLWSFLSCPVKILDEFDVFMDTVNRSYAIRFIFDFFKASKKQIILITPLSMREVFTDLCDVIVLEHNNE